MKWTYDDLITWDDIDDVSPNVIELDISWYNLTKLPSKIFKLVSLQAFYCHDNNVTTIPKELGQLVSLQAFNCSNNQLTTLPKELGQLVSLHTFYCYNNQLIDIQFSVLRNNLQEVKEYFNKPSISLVNACKGFIMQEPFHFIYE